MSDRFPLRPDAVWYDAMVARYGDAVPAIEHLQFRRGLQRHVADLFDALDQADRFFICRILSIVTRNGGFVIIDARIADAATEAYRSRCNVVFDNSRERLSESCEHCGRAGEIIAKTGLEALLDDPDAALGDRFLCTECYDDWSRHD